MKDETDMEVSSESNVISKTTIYNSGDLKWMAMLLDMDGMSNEADVLYRQRQRL